MRRRNFLKLVAAAAPALITERAYALKTGQSTAAIRQYGLEVLASYLDTLLPADESPSASHLDIHHALVEHALGVENYPQLLSLGCRWLDAMAGGQGSYSRLDLASRERIVVLAESQQAGKIERIFFERTLEDSMRLYYSHPDSWPSLGFTGPPQPIGFPDYRQAPK